MQTKYKMQPYERQQSIAIVKAYKAYKADVLNEEKYEHPTCDATLRFNAFNTPPAL